MSDEGSAFASFERKWLEANPEQAAVLIFLRSDQRQCARAFGTLIHELTQTAFVVRESQVAAAKLSWWQQELMGASAGNPRHPISRELFGQSRASAIDSTSWRALIDGAIAQLDASFPSTFEDLLASLSDFFTPVAAIETQLAGGSESQLDAVATLWICSHLLLVAQDVSHAAERTSMPLDLLARHGITRADLAASASNQKGVLKDFVGQIRDTIIEKRSRASSASLGRLVRSRTDRWLADRAICANDPAGFLSQHARNLRWRGLWWAWREARHLTSRSAIPKSERAA